jgi:hypothetical protein
MPTKRWTFEDELVALGQGWWLTIGYRQLIRREGGLPNFATDEEAIAFVREQASKGDPVCAKGLKLHEESLSLRHVDHGPQPEEGPRRILAI